MFNFAIENDAGKAVKTFCIIKINVAGSNFRVEQNYILSFAYIKP